MRTAEGKGRTMGKGGIWVRDGGERAERVRGAVWGFKALLLGTVSIRSPLNL